jgi:molecular chaperone GrpE
VAADFENYKKRVERERQDQIRFSNERLLKEILPIVDNLQRALDAAARSGEAPSISAGVELVIAETQKILRRAGVEPIAALNQPFDPAIHEALQRVETEAVEAGCVVNEVQPGYTLNGRVLRPALVTVAMPPEVTSPGMDRSDLD